MTASPHIPARLSPTQPGGEAVLTRNASPVVPPLSPPPGISGLQPHRNQRDNLKTTGDCGRE